MKFIADLHDNAMVPHLTKNVANASYSTVRHIARKADRKIAHFARYDVGNDKILGQGCPKRNSNVYIVLQKKLLLF